VGDRKKVQQNTRDQEAKEHRRKKKMYYIKKSRRGTDGQFILQVLLRRGKKRGGAERVGGNIGTKARGKDTLLVRRIGKVEEGGGKGDTQLLLVS